MTKYRVLARVRLPEPWEREASCNGCRRSRGVNREDPEVVAVAKVGSSGPGGSGSEFRFCAECMATVAEAFARWQRVEDALAVEREARALSLASRGTRVQMDEAEARRLLAESARLASERYYVSVEEEIELGKDV